MDTYLNSIGSIHPIPDEIIGGLLFLVSFAAFPASITCFLIGFRCRSRSSSYALFVVGGALLTQVRWYLVFMGVALGDKMGNMPYPVWGRFAFFGLGVGAAVLLISEVCRVCRTQKT